MFTQTARLRFRWYVLAGTLLTLFLGIVPTYLSYRMRDKQQTTAWWTGLLANAGTNFLCFVPTFVVFGLVIEHHRRQMDYETAKRQRHRSDCIDQLKAAGAAAVALRQRIVDELRTEQLLTGIDVDLRGANLSGLDFSDADLSGADLRRANLEGATLRRAMLRGTHLSGASLEKADLSHAKLYKASMRGTDLQGAKLLTADLTGAFIGGCRMEGAQLVGATLKGAIVREASVDEPSCDEKTMLPDARPWERGKVTLLDYTK